MSNKNGILYLIPTRLGDNPPLEVLPLSIMKVVDNTQYFIAENEKIARRFIKRIAPKKSQSKLTIFTLNKYTDDKDLPTFLNPCFNGKSLGLLSDAGCPAIADPGAKIVKLAHEQKIQVVPLVGPSSILLALMASGMNGQNFAFNGYLPIDKAERKSEIKRLERLSYERNQSQVFMETPYRNNKLIEDLCTYLNQNTRLCVASDITLSTEYIITKPIQQWKQEKVDIHKKPTIFIIHKD